MKSDISSLELNYVLRELQHLVGAKLEQVYQLGKEEIVMQFHVPNTGKQILRIVLGKLMYLASIKGSMPEKPPGFCLHLRKRLKSARLREISQLGFERIVAFFFETKDAKFRLIVELFSKGNIVLCNEDGKIISVLERQEWKDRSVKPGQVYDYPKKEFNFLTITEQEMSSFLNKSDKESLVKSLALDLGLGGVYAEEMCIQAKVDKNLKPNQLSDKEKASLLESAGVLINKCIESVVVYKDKSKKDVKDIVPFRLEFYKDLVSERKQSFSDALDSVLTKRDASKAIEKTESAASTKIGKVNEMISQQTLRVKGLEEAEKINQRKGEVIYENYPLVEQILREVNDLKKDISWSEIKKRFIGHKMIKDINDKTGEITLDL